MKASVYKIRFKKGDMVTVISGKYKGKSGKILAIHPKENKATVDGINKIKRHIKPTTKFPQGGIIEDVKPMWVSKLSLTDPTTKKASRIGYIQSKDGNKTRIYKSSGKEIK